LCPLRARPKLGSRKTKAAPEGGLSGCFIYSFLEDLVAGAYNHRQLIVICSE